MAEANRLADIRAIGEIIIKFIPTNIKALITIATFALKRPLARKSVIKKGNLTIKDF